MSIRNRPTAIVIAIGTALASVSGSAFAARLGYTLDVGVEDNDNIALTANDTIHERFLRTGLGFLFTQDSSTFQSTINGRAEYRNYSDDRFSDSIEGSLTGRFNWVAVPQRLHLTAEDDLSVQPVNSLAPNTPNNRQEVNVLSVGPTLFFRFGPRFRGQAELRFIDSKAEVTDEFDSRRTSAALRAISDVSATSALSWNLQGQRINFTGTAAMPDYDRYEAFARYTRTLTDFELGLEGGYTWLKYRTARDLGNNNAELEENSEPLARAYLTWHASPRSDLKLMASSVLSDTATEALGSLSQGFAEQPSSVLVGNAQVTGSPYRNQLYELGYSYTSESMTFTVGPFHEKRSYLNWPSVDESLNGGHAEISWRLRPSWTLSAYGRQENRKYSSIDRLDKTRYIGATLEKRWSRHWSTAAEYVRYDRDSSADDLGIKQNAVYLSVSYRRQAK